MGVNIRILHKPRSCIIYLVYFGAGGFRPQFAGIRGSEYLIVNVQLRTLHSQDTNNTDNIRYEYSEHAQIEKSIEGAWFAFSDIEGYGATDIAYYLNPRSSGKVKFYIQQYHEFIEAGEYRIVCCVETMNPPSPRINYDDYYEFISCEFSIQ